LSLLTVQNLLADKLRFLTSMSGVAFSVMLIALLLGLYQGWNLKLGRFVEKVEADVWVAREGTSDFINSASVLSANMDADLRSLPGVRQVDPLIVRPMKFQVGDKKQASHLVGYRSDADAAGGPTSLKKGRGVQSGSEVVIDDAFAKIAGLGLGGKFEVSGRTLEVVGISSGGDFIFSQTSFVAMDTARAIVGMESLVTFFLLRLEPGADAAAVISQVESRFPGVTGFTNAEFAAATRARLMDSFRPVLIIIVFLAFVVGVAVTGLTIYNQVTEKSREYGVLKAIGFTNRSLLRLVLEQSFITSAAGFVVGIGLAFAIGIPVSSAVPQFPVLIRPIEVVLVLILTLIMAGAAGAVPLRRITSVDPVSVFNS
jgi:putative ABC transport system permease protein